MSNVLIVDDDTELRSYLTEILTDEGYETVSASSAVEALEKCKHQVFDVALMDLMMPKMNGIDALQEIRRRHSKTKVIMITAFASVPSAVDAMKKGASDYISKPFKIPDLLTVIRRVLEESRFEESMAKLDRNQVFSAIANPIRRTIIKLLHVSGPMRLTEITRELDIDDHTKTVFHLKVLKEANIIEQDHEKAYVLNEGGRKAMTCLASIEEMLQD